MHNWITVKEFLYPHEAHILKSKLESEDIDVFLKDELAAQSNVLANAAHGVKVQIKESDLDKALPILMELGLIETNTEDHVSNILRILDTRTNRIPIIRKLALPFRLVSISMLIIFAISCIYYLFSLPSAKDRARYYEHIREYDLKYTWFPLLDSLVYYNPELAIRNIRSLKLDFPEEEGLYRYHGIALFNIDSFGSALEQFEQVIEKARFDYPLDLANIGHTKLKLGDFNSAADFFILAAEHKWEYNLDLANAYRKMGEFSEAQERYILFLDHWKEGKTLYDRNEMYNYVLAQLDSARQGI